MSNQKGSHAHFVGQSIHAWASKDTAEKQVTTQDYYTLGPGNTTCFVSKELYMLSSEFYKQTKFAIHIKFTQVKLV